MKSKKPKPLKDSARLQLAADCRQLAEQLDRPKADRVQRLLSTAAEFGYPATSSGSGAGTSGGNETDEHGRYVQRSTITERLALQPDRTANDATWLLLGLQRLHREIHWYGTALAQWHPDRPVRHCGVCGNPLEGTTTRCQRIINGVQCGAREKTERKCGNCGRQMNPGESLRKNLCNRCRMKLRRKTERTERLASIDRLKLGTGTDVIDAGATPNDPNSNDQRVAK